MRVLLINSNRCKTPWPMVPFGLCYVASAVEAAGHRVAVLDLCFSTDPDADIRRAIERHDPEAIGISVRNIDNATGYDTRFLLDDVKEHVVGPCRARFRGPVVIGGPAVGINAPEMLRFFGLEYAVRGDGERAMVELLGRLQRGEPLVGTPGLVIARGGRIVADNPPAHVDDLDRLPWPKAYRHVDLAAYRRYGSPLQVQTKRGCALSCSYCTYNRIEGRRWRLRDPEAVADEIEDLFRTTGIPDIEFTDSTFNLPLAHAKAVLRAVAARGLPIRPRAMGLNPGAVDEELADLLVACGFRDVDLGAESGCDATLRGLGKNFRKTDLLRAARILRERRIPVSWYLLLGAPGETPDTLAETFETIARAASPWDLVIIAIGVRAYAGSGIAERMRRESPRCTRDNFLRPVTYQPDVLDLASLKDLTRREALRRTNFLMYDEDEEMPLWLISATSQMLARFAPNQPVWRLFILMRKLQVVTGVNLSKRLRAAWGRWRVPPPSGDRSTPATPCPSGHPETSRAAREVACAVEVDARSSNGHVNGV